MADDYTQLNQGAGGDAMDEEAVTYGSAPTTRKRPRVVVGGSAPGSLAAVENTDPAPTDYALVVRDPAMVQVRNRFSPTTGSAPSNPISTAGDTTLWTPANGKSIRLLWIHLATKDSNAGTVVATLKLGGSVLYTIPLGKPGQFAHSLVREGSVNGLLVLNLDSALPVYVNFDLEEF